MVLRNITKNTVVAVEPRRARTFWNRTRGMIGRKFIGFDALVFEHCNKIHTFFMGQKIDVLFLTRDNRILKVVHGLGRFVPFCSCRRAATVVELPDGAAKSSRTETGDYLDLDVRTIEELHIRCGKTLPEIKPEASVSLYDGDTKI